MTTFHLFLVLLDIGNWSWIRFDPTIWLEGWKIPFEWYFKVLKAQQGLIDVFQFEIIIKKHMCTPMLGIYVSFRYKVRSFTSKIASQPRGVTVRVANYDATSRHNSWVRIVIRIIIHFLLFLQTLKVVFKKINDSDHLKN